MAKKRKRSVRYCVMCGNRPISRGQGKDENLCGSCYAEMYPEKRKPKRKIVVPCWTNRGYVDVDAGEVVRRRPSDGSVLGFTRLPKIPTMKRKAKTHRCAWCERGGATVQGIDLVDHRHWFHKGCRKDFKGWKGVLEKWRYRKLGS